MSNAFGTLGVPAPLLTALTRMDRTEPFPIQSDTLPDSLAGRDVLGRGRTGSGKTLAFAIPLVARLGGALAGGPRRGGHPLGLVLAPTRELATQIAATIEPLAAAYHLRVTTVFGGVSQRRQEDALRAGVEILVACPGRLEDLMRQGVAKLDAVEVTVIDEADHMADMGFLPGVTRILDATPADGQRMLFSATLDNGVDKLVRRFLHSPVMHSVDEETSPVERMTHHVFEVSADDKAELVRALASGRGRRILFMRTKHHAKKLAKQLTEQGIPAVDLQGNLSQPQRERNLAAFSDGGVRVLVATDVAARGVHVDEVELVVHVDPPTEHKAYLHRSGRTARAGAEGAVATIALPTQLGELKQLLRKAAIQATPLKVTADSAEVVELVGEAAAYVAPAPKEVATGGRGQRGGQRTAGQKPAGQRSGGRQQGGQQADGQSAGGRRSTGRRRGGSGAQQREQQGQGRQQERGGQQAQRGQQGSEQSRTQQGSAQPSGQPRRTGRRAGSAQGAPKLMVGSVVRPNRRGR